MRAKVPPHLRLIVGKGEIFRSLETKDFRVALKAVKIKSMEADEIIAKAEARFRGETFVAGPRSDEELRWMANTSFRDLESSSVQLGATIRDGEDREIVADNLQADLLVLTGSEHYSPHDTASLVESLVGKELAKWGFAEGSEDYKRAFPLFQSAIIENARRKVDRIRGRAIERIDFAGISESSLLPPRPEATITLGALLDEFMAYQRRSHAETTPGAYAMSVRALREGIGEAKPISLITKHDVERVHAQLERLPINAKQRFPGLSLERVIAVADRDNIQPRLSPRTVRNYLVHFVAIFNYAIHEGYIRENPAKSRILREGLKKTRTQKRPLFSDDELRSLFATPLYTGCVDDERGAWKKGNTHPRRGKFWIPLLALFQGFRCNEACQLHTADVGIEDGISFIHVREDSESEMQTEKRLKNHASVRQVPIHSELLKLGFMEFVAERRKDSTSARLFPELVLHPTKRRYSHAFSKWFSDYVKRACNPTTRATFHSLRHHFRTALMNASVSTEMAEALGGWSSEGSSEREYRHNQLPILKAALEKLSYPVRLSPLYR